MLKLTTPKSFLRFAKNMTVGELKNVTDQDLLQYKAEIESTLKADYEEDFGTVSESNQTMINLAVSVYGQESKQHKYLYRNFAKGESIVDTHYSVFPSSTELEQWVINSKSNFYEDYCVPANNYEKKEDN
jgi:hypothetical protein|tara:strand:+ start:1734 stop:2123 length:390 start_codon:yes stop_codon:yes gene_type:complete